MMWKNIAYLCATQTNPDGSPMLDEYRKPVKTFDKRKVFCNKKSVRQSEFYQAQTQGFQPQLMLEVHAHEYRGERYVEFCGKRFRIARTYTPKEEITELICTDVVAGNGK